MSSCRRHHVIFVVSSQTETEETHHNTATPSKERRRGRTAKDSGKEGDGRELHVGRVRSSSSDMPKGNIVLYSVDDEWVST
eukprot:scaffold1129_cov210-Alexandrium_tamarense.AAC.2